MKVLLCILLSICCCVAFGGVLVDKNVDLIVSVPDVMVFDVDESSVDMKLVSPLVAGEGFGNFVRRLYMNATINSNVKMSAVIDRDVSQHNVVLELGAGDNVDSFYYSPFIEVGNTNVSSIGSISYENNVNIIKNHPLYLRLSAAPGKNPAPFNEVVTLTITMESE